MIYIYSKQWFEKSLRYVEKETQNKIYCIIIWFFCVYKYDWWYWHSMLLCKHDVYNWMAFSTELYVFSFLTWTRILFKSYKHAYLSMNIPQYNHVWLINSLIPNPPKMFLNIYIHIKHMISPTLFGLVSTNMHVKYSITDMIYLLVLFWTKLINIL